MAVQKKEQALYQQQKKVDPEMLQRYIMAYLQMKGCALFGS